MALKLRLKFSLKLSLILVLFLILVLMVVPAHGEHEMVFIGHNFVSANVIYGTTTLFKVTNV